MVAVVGVNFFLWSIIAAIRILTPASRDHNHIAVAIERRGRTTQDEEITASDVAVIIPAHNEETVIASTIESVLQRLPAQQIHVVADGCVDATARIAKQLGVHVIELDPAHGKARGIEEALGRFAILDRFAVVLILDADTELGPGYMRSGLRLLNKTGAAAVAGYALSRWQPEQLPLVGRFLVAYRIRLYTVMQWIRYGQTWRYTNVTAVVPGFASMYRTNALRQIEVNPPGLVIEDFNMTFELHRKRLGKVAFGPSMSAMTQDPDNLRDYCRQVMRWSLGFWQTVRRHGFWPSLFSLTLALFLLETLTSSIILLGGAAIVMLLAVPSLVGDVAQSWGWYVELRRVASPYMTPANLLLLVFLPDFLLTCCAALWMRRPGLLIYGPSFIFIRLIDAAAMLWTLPQSLWRASSGRWTSPKRRSSLLPVRLPGKKVRTSPLSGLPAVMRDSLAMAGAIAVGAVLVALSLVPVMVLLASLILLIGLGATLTTLRGGWKA